MEERKYQIIGSNEEYEQEIGKIRYYLNRRAKHALLAYGGKHRKIGIFSNSLGHMGYLQGHNGILCLAALSKTTILASGSADKTIKVWNLEKKALISRALSQHTEGVTALCHVNSKVLVSGSMDKSLIVWGDITGKFNYMPRHKLTLQASCIQGIISINAMEIISGELMGDLRIWNLEQGTCTTHIHRVISFECICDMKKLEGNTYINAKLVFCTDLRIYISQPHNNWESQISKFGEFRDIGTSIEFISEDLLIRGGKEGSLIFIGCTETLIIQLSNYILAVFMIY